MDIKKIKEGKNFLVDIFKNYIAILINPKKFFINHSFGNEKDLKDALLFALVFVFLTISIYLPIILGPQKTILIPNGIDLSSPYIIGLLSSTLLLIVIFAWTIHISWRIFGGKAVFTQIVTIYSYYFGVLIFAFGLLHFLNLAIFYGMKRTFYEVFINFPELIYNEGLTQVFKKYPAESSSYVLPHIVFGLGWGIWGWGAYRNISEVKSKSKSKSLLSFILTGVISMPILFIYFLIQSVIYDHYTVAIR
jgi:hypothetical protein